MAVFDQQRISPPRVPKKVIAFEIRLPNVVDRFFFKPRVSLAHCSPLLLSGRCGRDTVLIVLTARQILISLVFQHPVQLQRTYRRLSFSSFHDQLFHLRGDSSRRVERPVALIRQRLSLLVAPNHFICIRLTLFAHIALILAPLANTRRTNSSLILFTVLTFFHGISLTPLRFAMLLFFFKTVHHVSALSVNYLITS